MRWIWIDRFVEFEPGRRAKAIKNLTQAEDYFREHLPGYPIFPISLLLEGLAQTGGILVGEAGNFERNVVLAKIASVQVHAEVYPGQQLEYEVELLDLREEGATVRGIARVQAQVVAEAEIMFAHVRPEQIGLQENFVFSGELKKLLALNRLLPPGKR
ncbi:MAG: 3-hydroxyacyl-ACP dehydratase FabZ family protein [Gemmatales bacterium]|nr:beta-hydroxyacyl-ACP dehydratase [Gemmatales bacterium]MDW7993019.1 3-hydroxyacyl-ACP dehydratase FabZ family protein [Gemmatales bacterium]